MRKYVLIGAAVVVTLAIVGALAGYFVVFAPNTQIYEDERGVKIPPGTGFEGALDSLEAAGVLGSRTTMGFLGRVTGWGGQVKAGYYTFDAGVSNYRMLNVLRRGLQSPIRLTLPPGTRPEVLAAVAGGVMAFDAAAFDSTLSDPSLARRLGTDTTALFGYMMPETYFFYWLTDADRVVAKVKEQFDTYYERELATGADALELSKEELTTIASIVEWETGYVDEKPRVAGVYLNRLRIGMALQADPTVQFAVLQREGAKRRLLYEDYRIQHAYNTYLFTGLPPGPITNPSPSSLKAVADAEQHDFLYFVARGDGRHTFSRTLREHNQAAAQYRRLMRERRRNPAAGISQ